LDAGVPNIRIVHIIHALADREDKSGVDKIGVAASVIGQNPTVCIRCPLAHCTLLQPGNVSTLRASLSGDCKTGLART